MTEYLSPILCGLHALLESPIRLLQPVQVFSKRDLGPGRSGNDQSQVFKEMKHEGCFIDQRSSCSLLEFVGLDLT